MDNADCQAFDIHQNRTCSPINPCATPQSKNVADFVRMSPYGKNIQRFVSDKSNCDMSVLKLTSTKVNRTAHVTTDMTTRPPMTTGQTLDTTSASGSGSGSGVVEILVDESGSGDGEEGISADGLIPFLK